MWKYFIVFTYYLRNIKIYTSSNWIKRKTKKEAKKQEKGLLYRADAADAEPTLLGLIPSGWHEKICSKFWSSLFARVCAISWLV